MKMTFILMITTLGFLSLVIPHLTTLAQDVRPENEIATVKELIRLLGSDQFEVREDAQKRLVDIGPAALKDLQDALKDPDSEIQNRASVCISEIKSDMVVTELVVQLQKGPLEMRIEAACLLNNLGPAAAKAVPALIGAMEDAPSTLRCPAMGALGEIGPAAKKAIPRMMAIAEDPNEPIEIRTVAISCVGTFGTLADEMIPRLLKQTQNNNVDMVRIATGALGRVGKNKESLVPELLKLLRHNDEWVRCTAASALGRIGKQPQIVVPALICLMKTEKVMVNSAGPRQKILYGLEQFGPQAKSAIPMLLELISNKEENEELRQIAISVLESMGKEARITIPTLTKLLESPEYVFLHHEIKRTINSINMQENK